MKIINIKTSFLLFLILMILCLYGCRYHKNETYKLKQLVNTSTTTFHGSFLGSSSSTYDQIVKFAYYIDDVIYFNEIYLKNCQVVEDVANIQDSYVNLKGTIEHKTITAERKLRISGPKRTDVIAQFHIPQNTMQNFYNY